MTKTCPTCSQSNQLLRFRIRRLLWTIFFVGTVIAAIATTYQSSRLQQILGKLRITNHELNQEVRRLKTATKKPLFQISTIAQTDHTLKGEITSVHQLRVAEFWKYRIQKSVFHYHDPQATAFQLRVENDLLSSESFIVCRVDRKRASDRGTKNSEWRSVFQGLPAPHLNQTTQTNKNHPKRFCDSWGGHNSASLFRLWKRASPTSYNSEPRSNFRQ